MMRIAQVAPLDAAVSSREPAPVARVIAALTDVLVDRGHDVTLFACEGSETAAHLVSCGPVRRAHPQDEMYLLATFAQWLAVAQRAGTFDVIHSHGGYVPHVLSGLLPTPWVTTLHRAVRPHEVDAAHTAGPGGAVVAVSHRQWRELNGLRCCMGVIHNGVDVLAFSPSTQPGTYVATVAASEGAPVDTALAVAAAARLAVKLAVAPGAEPEVGQRIAARASRCGAAFVGVLRGGQEAAFLGQALAYLDTTDRSCVFDLTPVAAMACGTPVLCAAEAYGSEVLRQGVTGYVCPSIAAAVDALRRVHRVNRMECRLHAERRFSSHAMARAYERAYEQVRQTGGSADRARAP